MLQIGRTTILDFIICVLKKRKAQVFTIRYSGLGQPSTSYGKPALRYKPQDVDIALFHVSRA